MPGALTFWQRRRRFMDFPPGEAESGAGDRDLMAGSWKGAGPGAARHGGGGTIPGRSERADRVVRRMPTSLLSAGQACT